MLTVESTSVETVTVAGIVSPTEPTGNPEFQLTEGSVTDPPSGDWVEGAWSGTWVADGTGLSAVSPTFGTAGFVPDSSVRPQLMWIRWVAGSHVPVRRVTSVYAN